MATHAGRFSQDQNFNVHFDGSFVGEKTNGSKPQKKGGGLPGRRALHDISNSGTLQPSRKNNSMNVLRDLTNSARPSGQQVLKKKSQDKKIISVAEDNVPKAIAEERFLHNHQECIKARSKALSPDYFLKLVRGLDDDYIWAPPLLSLRARQVSSQSNDDSPVKLFEMEEELSEMETRYLRARQVSSQSNDDSPVKLFEMEEELSEMKTRYQSPGHNSPVFGSPKSPKLSFMDREPNFTLIESPDRSKH